MNQHLSLDVKVIPPSVEKDILSNNAKYDRNEYNNNFFSIDIHFKISCSKKNQNLLTVL